MKPFFLLFLGLLQSGIAAAQYPATNYWFAELGGALPFSVNKQSIYKKLSQKPVEWAPASQLFFNSGWHLESMEGRFLEMFFDFRGNDIDDPSILVGTRFGGGKNRWRYFLEVNGGSFTGNGGMDEPVNLTYGAGFRYRLTKRMSLQTSFLRNHFSQYFRVAPPYKHPVRSFVAASLYWNLNIKSDKLAKAPKVKKLSPRRQNRCPYSPSNT
jgi:hypothetical protein